MADVVSWPPGADRLPFERVKQVFQGPPCGDVVSDGVGNPPGGGGLQLRDGVLEIFGQPHRVIGTLTAFSCC